jgi:ribonuclease HI
VVASWPACEARVSGRKARYRGFPDRASAERWLAADGDDRAGQAPGPRKVYAYRTETSEGVVDSWAACSGAVEGHKARYRSFPDAASARRWLADGARYEDRVALGAAAVASLPDDAVYFDSGTGPGHGAEVRITDRAGASLLHLAGDLPPGSTATAAGNLILGRSRTNNYGELLACLLALRVAEHTGTKAVLGDSRLVLDYWSKDRVSAAKRASDPALSELAREAAQARRAFERAGGRLAHVSGSVNPADLGYHRD